MNLDNLISVFDDYPFKHWEISNCLNVNTLDEISLFKDTRRGSSL